MLAERDQVGEIGGIGVELTVENEKTSHFRKPSGGTMLHIDKNIVQV
jgi:hypothetical protein